jgi:hypothetical protein
MGVNCDSSAIYVAVVENGTVLEGHADRIQVPTGLPSEGRLVAVFDDAGRVIVEIKPGRIALLRPEGHLLRDARAIHAACDPRSAPSARRCAEGRSTRSSIEAGVES